MSEVHRPPPGMEWEWGDRINDTDWFGASPELVNSVVKVYADPKLGPVLQVGCGDAPVPELLIEAGFPKVENIDIAPQVISMMRQKYPAKDWPGLTFKVRDFLEDPEFGGGAPTPHHRFSAVIDKAGIWDWLQDEAPKNLPRLLAAAHQALVEPPKQGTYIIVTKQTPRELSDTLRLAGPVGTKFAVEASVHLGGKGIAWAYVLIPI